MISEGTGSLVVKEGGDSSKMLKIGLKGEAISRRRRDLRAVSVEGSGGGRFEHQKKDLQGNGLPKSGNKNRQHKEKAGGENVEGKKTKRPKE